MVFVGNSGRIEKLEHKALQKISGLHLRARVLYNDLKVRLALNPDDTSVKQVRSYDEMCALLAEERMAERVRNIRSDAVERAVKPSDVAGVREAARDATQAEAMARGEDDNESDSGDEDVEMTCAECDAARTSGSKRS
jgi:hypothetical protein